jgi:predicted dinucleotide-binding enzyme
MRIAMIGGGMVGQTLGTALLARGHEVTIGIRDPSAADLARPRAQAAPLAEWQAKTGGRVAPMAEAAARGEIVFNVTEGRASLAALRRAGAENLAGKVLVDVANALDFSRGMPAVLDPDLTLTTSLGEEIQKAHPAALVVKAFNTVAAPAMVNPALIAGEPDLMIAGNSDAAKAQVAALARDFGWRSIVDLGGIEGARGSEHLLPIWLRLFMTGGSPLVALKVLRG